MSATFWLLASHILFLLIPWLPTSKQRNGIYFLHRASDLSVHAFRKP